LLDGIFIVDAGLFETFDFVEMLSNLNLLCLCWMKENETPCHWQFLEFDAPRSPLSCFCLVIFLKFIRQLIQSFEVLDGDSHFLDFLGIAVILFN